MNYKKEEKEDLGKQEQEKKEQKLSEAEYKK
jgi:hypothetical protein